MFISPSQLSATLQFLRRRSALAGETKHRAMFGAEISA